MADSLFLQDVFNTPRSLADTVSYLDDHIDAVTTTLLDHGVRRVVALGSGSSWFAAATSVYVHNALAPANGTLALAAASADYSLYPLPLAARDAVVGVSVSGELMDLLALMEILRGRHPLIGITNRADASLTRLVDHVLLMQAGESMVPTSTKSFVTSVAALDLLWLSLLARQGVTEAVRLRTELRSLPQVVDEAIVQARGQVEAIAQRLAGCTRLFVLGTGPLYPLAQEVALVFKEVASRPAEAVQTREMAQGTTAVVDPTVGVIVMNPPGRGRKTVQDIVTACATLGATIVEVGPTADDLHLEIACHDLLLPLAYSSPLFMLAGRVGALHGIDSDHPHWEASYRRMTRRDAQGG